MKRKTATRPRRRSRRKVSHRGPWVAALLVLGAAIFGYLGGSTLYHRVHSRPQHIARKVTPPSKIRPVPAKNPPSDLEEDPRTLARLESAVERAGGQRVWVRLRLKGRPIRVEVLATAEAFGGTVEAISSEAPRCGLEAEVERSKQPGRAGVARIALRRNGQTLGAWRVRQVPQILRAAIIVDDLGQNLEAARELVALPYPLTFSVLPHLQHSEETAQVVHGAGREVMLHLPMEPEPGSRERPGPGVVTEGMRDSQVAGVVNVDLASVPYACGVNNHMGSRATRDGALMAEVMKVLADHRLFFVDSRTTPRTVAQDAARQAGVPSFARSVFLDDTESVSYTVGQLQKFCQVIARHGAALAIGHPYPSTIAALREFLPEFDRQDIQLVPASELAERSAGQTASRSAAAASSR